MKLATLIVVSVVSVVSAAGPARADDLMARETAFSFGPSEPGGSAAGSAPTEWRGSLAGRPAAEPPGSDVGGYGRPDLMPATGPGTRELAPQPSPVMQAGRWTFETLGTFIGSVDNRHVQMGGGTVGLGYCVLPRTAILIDGSGYGFSEGRIDGGAVGVTVGLRQHLLELKPFGLEFDVSGGIIGANRQLPYYGTHFNETIEVGPAVTVKLNDAGLSLLVGVRYFHLSNADRTGQPGRNPSINGIQGVFGLVWRF